MELIKFIRQRNNMLRPGDLVLNKQSLWYILSYPEFDGEKYKVSCVPRFKILDPQNFWACHLNRVPRGSKG